MNALPRSAPRILPRPVFLLWPFLGTGPYGSPLLFIKNGTLDTIGLSTENYGQISAYWQEVFFTDPDTPITHTYDEWMVILLADSEINNDIVLAVDGGGALVYAEGTAQSILDRGLVYLQNQVVVPDTNAVTWTEEHLLTDNTAPINL